MAKPRSSTNGNGRWRCRASNRRVSRWSNPRVMPDSFHLRAHVEFLRWWVSNARSCGCHARRSTERGEMRTVALPLRTPDGFDACHDQQRRSSRASVRRSSASGAGPAHVRVRRREHHASGDEHAARLWCAPAVQGAVSLKPADGLGGWRQRLKKTKASRKPITDAFLPRARYARSPRPGRKATREATRSGRWRLLVIIWRMWPIPAASTAAVRASQLRTSPRAQQARRKPMHTRPDTTAGRGPSDSEAGTARRPPRAHGPRARALARRRGGLGGAERSLPRIAKPFDPRSARPRQHPQARRRKPDQRRALLRRDGRMARRRTNALGGLRHAEGTTGVGVERQANLAYNAGMRKHPVHDTPRAARSRCRASPRGERDRQDPQCAWSCRRLRTRSCPPPTSEHDDLDWFVGQRCRTASDEADAAQAWLDALPVEPPREARARHKRLQGPGRRQSSD